MIKGWRLLFYAVIGVAVLSIAYITVNYILTERLVKATGDGQLAVRQAAARKVMGRAAVSESGRRKAMDFLRGQPQTVRDNVVWSVEKMAEQGGDKRAAIEWLVQIACDLSGSLPAGEADRDAARLAVQRLGLEAVDPLIVRVGETTHRTLERENYAHRRAVAARLLGLIGDAKAVKPLVKALRDDYEAVRQQAAAALARINTPDSRTELDEYLRPLLGVLDGRYYCWVRLDSEGRIRQALHRESMVYGPFVVKVKPYEEASDADLKRQRDSAEEILEKEQKRQAETRKRLEEGRRGQVLRVKKGPLELAIEKVTLVRRADGGGEDVVEDPARAEVSLIEGEPLEVRVDVANRGPENDLVNDFYVAIYGASRKPKNHPDRPTAKGEFAEFAGERARDLRALAGTAEVRHVRTMYAKDRPETPEDDTRDRVFLTMRFNAIEGDRIEALRQLMSIADENSIDALGRALSDRSYTVRRQAALALEQIAEARHISAAARGRILATLQQKGLTSSDPVVRCLAAEGSRLGSSAATGRALQGLLLTDRDATVRLVATRAMAGLPAEERERLLPGLAAQDESVRLVVPRLFASKQDAALARRLLFGNEPAVAREVLRSAQRFLSTQDLVDVVQKLTDPRTRALGARLLADREDPAAKPALLAALNDKQGEVRAAAAAGLGILLAKQAAPDAQVVSALVKVINQEAGEYVGVPEKKQPEDPSTAVITDKQSRAAAVAALAGQADAESAAALTEALKDNNPDVLAAVMPAVAKGTVKGQNERLIKIITDTKTMPARVRQAAILALWTGGEGKDTKALDALVGLLNDPNNAIKTSAAVALIGLGDSRGDKVLRDQLNSKSADVRREAAKLMATLPEESVKKLSGIKAKDRDGLNVLIEELYLTGSLPVNFRFICGALTFLVDQPRTVQRLQAALKDDHPALRAAAVTVLAQAKDANTQGLARAAAMDLLADKSELVRAAALNVAWRLKVTEAKLRIAEQIRTTPDASEQVRRAALQAVTQLGAID